ncbi:MAG: hypothetical protein VYC34_03295 [Planctomycetota bacterium]|nr:hypothetical protein [Planctomycetota bacterium]
MTAAVFALLLAAVAPVELRGGVVIEQPVAEIGPEGVTLGGEAPRVLSWDRVRAVTGPKAAEAKQYEQIAEDCWRAVTRLERGDAAMAEPLFERLFALYRAQEGPTAQVVAEGYLRCLVERNAQLSAVRVWLECVRLARASGETINAIDETTLLAPSLPPCWSPSAGLSTIVRTWADLETDDAVTAALRDWCVFAARCESGESASPPAADAEAAVHPGVRLVAQLTLAQYGDASQRAAARQELAAGLVRDEGTWREAWRRFAIGRSFLREDDAALRRRGMIELLHVPARFSSTQPYLAGLAVAEAAQAMMERGELTGAASLRTELERQYAGHPAIDWLRLNAATFSVERPEPRETEAGAS